MDHIQCDDLMHKAITREINTVAGKKGWLTKTEHVTQNMPLVIKQAKYAQLRYQQKTGRTIPLADLIQTGTLGLMRGLKTFDTYRGYAVSTYVSHWIFQHIQTETNRKRRADENHQLFTREELPGKETDEANDMLASETIELIKNAVASLDSRSASVIRQRFGLDGRKPQSLEALGKTTGLSKERVRQIEMKALRKLAQHDQLRKHNDE